MEDGGLTGQLSRRYVGQHKATDREDVVKKLMLLAGVIAGLVAINARIDAARRCGCQPVCWCKQPGLSHFRWLLPYGHKGYPSEWKQDVET